MLLMYVPLLCSTRGKPWSLRAVCVEFAWNVVFPPLPPSGRGITSPALLVTAIYLNWKLAVWLVPSLSVSVNCRHVPTHTFCVFHT